MNKAFLAGLLGSLVISLLAFTSFRAAEPRRPEAVHRYRRHQQYADKQIKPRPYAEDDAKALYDLFTNKDYLGADADNVRLLLGERRCEAEESKGHAREHRPGLALAGGQRPPRTI